VSKVQHKPIKRLKLGFKRNEQKKLKWTLVWRTELSGAPGWIDFKLFSFEFLRPRSAIIHRTVRWASRATAPAQRSTPTDTCKSATVHGQFTQSQSSARRHTGQWIVHVRCDTGLSDAPSCQSSNYRNRQNPNGWVTWLAHQTVLVVGVYSRHPSFQHIAFNTRALDFTPRHKQEIKSSPKSKTTPTT
jgi:hypothetical protein